MSNKKQKNAKKSEKLSKEKLKKISGGLISSPTPVAGSGSGTGSRLR